MIRVVLAAIVWVGAVVVTTCATADDIHLICTGTVTFAEINHGGLFASDNRGNFGSANGYAESRGESDGEVMFDVTGDKGRVKVPLVMVPALHDADDNGWRTLDKLIVGDAEIVGKFSFNFADKPSVEIDRVSGHIEIKGINKRTFRGDCRPYDAATDRRF